MLDLFFIFNYYSCFFNPDFLIMKNKPVFSFICIGLLLCTGAFIPSWGQGALSINDQGYFEMPGLERGGWHDAGDYDLRIESQAVSTWRLAMMYELFNIDYR
jgi:hypothetical protein